jgi:hypothetical protein
VTKDISEVELIAAGSISSAQDGLSRNQDIVHLYDVIIDGSLCVGFDWVNGERFGFDTFRLKENNLRIKFQDTSNSASFPGNDGQITAHDSSNGGANKFSINDINGGKTPFTLEWSKNNKKPLLNLKRKSLILRRSKNNNRSRPMIQNLNS